MKKRARETIPRFRRTHDEIAMGLNRETAEAARKEVERIEKIQKEYNKAVARKNRIERLKLLAANKSDNPKEKPIPQMPVAKTREKKKNRIKAKIKAKEKRTEFFERLDRKGCKYQNVEEIVARIRRNAAMEVAADPLLNRDLYKKTKLSS
jgi:nicotinamide mononucleotide adenylyltransferase